MTRCPASRVAGRSAGGERNAATGSPPIGSGAHLRPSCASCLRRWSTRANFRAPAIKGAAATRRSRRATRRLTAIQRLWNGGSSASTNRPAPRITERSVYATLDNMRRADWDLEADARGFCGNRASMGERCELQPRAGLVGDRGPELVALCASAERSIRSVPYTGPAAGWHRRQPAAPPWRSQASAARRRRCTPGLPGPRRRR